MRYRAYHDTLPHFSKDGLKVKTKNIGVKHLFTHDEYTRNHANRTFLPRVLKLGYEEGRMSCGRLP